MFIMQLVNTPMITNNWLFKDTITTLLTPTIFTSNLCYNLSSLFTISNIKFIHYILFTSRN